MKAGALPLAVADWPRSERGRIRITNHADVIDLRTFFIDDDESAAKPGKVAITLPLQCLWKLAEAMQKADFETNRPNLVDHD